VTLLCIFPGPRYRLTFEPPHEPTLLDVRLCLTNSRPVQPDGSRLTRSWTSETLDLAHHQAAEIVEVAQEDLGAGCGRASRLRERHVHSRQTTS